MVAGCGIVESNIFIIVAVSFITRNCIFLLQLHVNTIRIVYVIKKGYSF